MSLNQITRARFNGKADFNIGMPRAGCPYPSGPMQNAWLGEWDRCAEAQKSRRPTQTEPANRQTIAPFPERPNHSGPED